MAEEIDGREHYGGGDLEYPLPAEAERIRQQRAPAHDQAAFVPEGDRLKAQVRAFEDTYSLNDAFAAERARLSQGPALLSDRQRAERKRAELQRLIEAEAAELGDTPEAHRYITAKKRILRRMSTARLLRVDDPLASYNLPRPPSLTISVVTRTGADGVPEVVGTIDCRWPDSNAYGPAWRRELMWAAHNLIVHPFSEVTHWIGFLIPPVRTFGTWLHDLTVPPHAPNTGRG